MTHILSAHPGLAVLPRHLAERWDPFGPGHPTSDAPPVMPDMVAHMTGHISDHETAIEELAGRILATWDHITYPQQCKLMRQLGDEHAALTDWKGHLHWYLSHTR